MKHSSRLLAKISNQSVHAQRMSILAPAQGIARVDETCEIDELSAQLALNLSNTLIKRARQNINQPSRSLTVAYDPLIGITFSPRPDDPLDIPILRIICHSLAKGLPSRRVEM
jgi:hypothetical protein